MKQQDDVCTGCRYSLTPTQQNSWSGPCIMQNFRPSKRIHLTSRGGKMVCKSIPVEDGGREDVPRTCPRYLEQLILNQREP